MRRVIKPKICAAAVLATAALAAVPASASAGATLLSVNDSLDKTTFGGLAVGGLSALAYTSGSQALALTDNQGATPARFFTLKVRGERVETTKVTTLKRVDGTFVAGQDFDGEGLVVEPDGTLLISSETEPVIRRFDRARATSYSAAQHTAAVRGRTQRSGRHEPDVRSAHRNPGRSKTPVRRHGGPAQRRRSHPQPDHPLRQAPSRATWSPRHQ